MIIKSCNTTFSEMREGAPELSVRQSDGAPARALPGEDELEGGIGAPLLGLGHGLLAQAEAREN